MSSAVGDLGNRNDLSAADLESLVEQRDFLLKSLDDLDREHAAGDIDDGDYETLRNDYTVRAAATIRSIEAKQTRVVAPSTKNYGRKAAWVVAIAAIAIVAGLVIARASGSRLAGEFGSGDVRSSTPSLLLKASDALEQGDYDTATGFYDDVLEIDPTNVEALTYRAWATYRVDPSPEGGRASEVVERFAEASALEPDYPDARVFAAIVLADRDEVVEAATQLEAFDAVASEDSFMDSLVEQRSLRETIAGKVFATGLSIDQSPYDETKVVALGRSAADKQMITESLALFGVVLEENPRNVEALTYQGWLLARIAAFPPEGLDAATIDTFANDAFALFDQAIEIDPTYPDAWAVRAFFNNQLGNFDDAKRDLETALSFDDLPPELRAEIEDPQYRLLELLES